MNTLFDDFRASLHSIWQRRWLALAVAWLVCVLGWLGVTLVPNAYESRARIAPDKFRHGGFPIPGDTRKDFLRDGKDVPACFIRKTIVENASLMGSFGEALNHERRAGLP